LEPEGFVVDMLSFVGKLRVDEKVENSINATIQATQKAIEAENKVKESEAVAKQHIAEAEGEAKAILTRAESQAKANDLLAKSLTPEVVNFQAMQKWDGVLPTVTGSGGIPFIQLQPKQRETK
jgi:regulator of protease activity HflC (stomatin/prohibitin superfamily)